MTFLTLVQNIISKGPKYRFPSNIDFPKCRGEIAASLNDFYMCFVVTCWERADLLALVCGVFCEFVTFPLVSWVRCGT